MIGSDLTRYKKKNMRRGQHTCHTNIKKLESSSSSSSIETPSPKHSLLQRAFFFPSPSSSSTIIQNHSPCFPWPSTLLVSASKKVYKQVSELRSSHKK